MFSHTQSTSPTNLAQPDTGSPKSTQCSENDNLSTLPAASQNHTHCNSSKERIQFQGGIQQCLSNTAFLSPAPTPCPYSPAHFQIGSILVDLHGNCKRDICQTSSHCSQEQGQGSLQGKKWSLCFQFYFFQCKNCVFSQPRSPQQLNCFHWSIPKQHIPLQTTRRNHVWQNISHWK